MPSSDRFLGSVFTFAMGVSAGLLLYLVVASVVGWIQPVWWGGSALFVPTFFGGAFVIIGAIPLCAIAKKSICSLAGTCSSLNTFAAGVLVGIGSLPLSDGLGALLRAIALWQSVNPWVAVTLTLSAAGVLTSLIAACLIGTFLRIK